jgi:hypothetical protein
MIKYGSNWALSRLSLNPSFFKQRASILDIFRSESLRMLVKER